MVELKSKREVTISKWLIIGLVISIVLNLILIISPKVQANPLLVISFTIIAIVFVVLQAITSQKPKRNVFDAVHDIKQSMERSRLPSSSELNTDVGNWKAWPLGPTRFLIYFIKESQGFIWDNGVITAKDPREYMDTLRYVERSDIFKDAVQTERIKRITKQRADELGIDRKSVGLEPDEEDD